MARTTAVAKKSTSTAVATVNRSDAAAALRARLMAPTGDKIKIAEKQFKLPSGDTLDFLDVVVVDFVFFNAYYESAYQAGTVVPPACFSLNPDVREMVPSANSPEKQHDACKGCWANEFGSNGKGKACQNRCLIAMLPTDATEETPFVILDISPTAVKGFNSYLSSIARSGKMPYEVVTHIECNPATKYDVAIFDKSQDLEDDPFVGMIESRLDEARDRLMTEPDVSATKAANDSAPAKGGRNLKAPAKRRA